VVDFPIPIEASQSKNDHLSPQMRSRRSLRRKCEQWQKWQPKDGEVVAFDTVKQMDTKTSRW